MKTKLFAVKYMAALKFAKGDSSDDHDEPDHEETASKPLTPDDAATDDAAMTDYHEQTRQAFENSIDANPLDAHNHLVYADWLEENGYHDEAAFRRSMGEWHQENIDRPDRNPHRPTTMSEARNFPWVVADHEHYLPSGVLPWYIPNWIDRPWPRSDNDRPQNPSHALRIMEPSYGFNRRWQSYRNMEDAFRQAFMAHRNRNN